MTLFFMPNSAEKFDLRRRMYPKRILYTNLTQLIQPISVSSAGSYLAEHVGGKIRK